VGLRKNVVAADTRLEAAIEQERDQLKTKVELSTGIQAEIAAMRYLNEQSVPSMDSKLQLLEIQNRVYNPVKAIRMSCIDCEGAVPIGPAKYPGGILAGKKSATCRKLRKHAFSRPAEVKVMGVEEFADPFTLEQLCPYY